MFKFIVVRFKWLVLLATVLSAISALSGIGMLKIITLQIGAMTSQSAASVTPFVWFLLAVSAVLLFGLMSRYLLARLGARVVYEFRDSLTRRLLSTPYAIIERIGGHRILAALKTDAAKLSEGLLILPEFIYSLITVVLCLSYMSYLSGRLFLVSTALIILLGLIASVFLRYGLRHFKHLRHYEDTLFQGMQMMVDGSQELSINARRRHFIYERVLKTNYRDIRHLSVRVSLIFTMLNSIGSTLIFFSGRSGGIRLQPVFQRHPDRLSRRLRAGDPVYDRPGGKTSSVHYPVSANLPSPTVTSKGCLWPGTRPTWPHQATIRSQNGWHGRRLTSASSPFTIRQMQTISTTLVSARSMHSSGAEKQFF
ncbi:hypothetical protein DZS_50910 [Dickeya ananatis]